MTGIVFKFGDPNHGWLEVSVSNGITDVNFIFSDVPCNSIEKLACALLKLQVGSEQEAVEFSLEPNYAICEFRVKNDELTLFIFPDARLVMGVSQ